MPGLISKKGSHGKPLISWWELRLQTKNISPPPRPNCPQTSSSLCPRHPLSWNNPPPLTPDPPFLFPEQKICKISETSTEISWFLNDFSGCRRRGVEFKGGSLHDGFGSFDGFGGFDGKHLVLLLVVLQNAVPRGSRDGFDGFGGCSSFGRDSYPP